MACFGAGTFTRWVAFGFRIQPVNFSLPKHESPETVILANPVAPLPLHSSKVVKMFPA